MRNRRPRHHVQIQIWNICFIILFLYFIVSPPPSPTHIQTHAARSILGTPKPEVVILPQQKINTQLGLIRSNFSARHTQSGVWSRPNHFGHTQFWRPNYSNFAFIWLASVFNRHILLAQKMLQKVCNLIRSWAKVECKGWGAGGQDTVSKSKSQTFVLLFCFYIL